MFTRNGLILATAGALAIAAVSFPVHAGAARDRTAVTTEFSAETKAEEEARKKKAAPKAAPNQAPARIAPPVHIAPRQAPVHVAPRIEERRIERHVVPQGGGLKKLESQKTLGPKIVTPGAASPKIITGPTAGGPKTARRTFTPRGTKSSIVSAARIRSAPARGAFRTTIRGRNYSVWRSGYRARHGNRWRTFVALGALGVIAIGAAEYYPYAYIDAPEDYCDGRTADGCQLVFDEVETMEGDLIGQCVAYCPWR
jgi:hypothetical protein